MRPHSFQFILIMCLCMYVVMVFFFSTNTKAMYRCSSCLSFYQSLSKHRFSMLIRNIVFVSISICVIYACFSRFSKFKRLFFSNKFPCIFMVVVAAFSLLWFSELEMKCTQLSHKSQYLTVFFFFISFKLFQNIFHQVYFSM